MTSKNITKTDVILNRNDLKQPANLTKIYIKSGNVQAFKTALSGTRYTQIFPKSPIVLKANLAVVKVGEVNDTLQGDVKIKLCGSKTA